MGLVHLIRPKQWIKNGFVAAPLIFSGEFLNPEALEQTVWAIMLFCLASSSTYILNDLHDVEADRKHPKKSQTRPLAKGIVSISVAWGLYGLINSILLLSVLFIPKIMLVIAAYIVLTCAYTFVLKEQPIVDLFVISIGFVLRVYAGAVALAVPVSSWMFITTFCLALYLAAIKRRQEYVQAGIHSRTVLEKYSMPLLDYYAQMSAIGALMFYSMFVLSSKPQLVMTIPLVLFGLFRYAFIVDSRDDGESPTDALLTDWPLIMTLFVWAGACVWLIF
jgi:4-hydroxybenzoate polyprenyltransferase